MARGTKGTKDPELTPKQFEDMVRLLSIGMTVTDVCKMVGIHRDTFYKWAGEGKKRPPSDPLRVFADAVARGKMTAKSIALGHVQLGMKKDWKAAAWYLGVTYPKDFGPKVKVTVEQELGAALERLAKVLPEDMYERALDAISGAVGEEGEAEVGPEAGGTEEGSGT